uniref:Uncharacterized protein n=1 Tax=viral metagenome TaxID=1070528 RepID=A0A6M3KJR9_9ZZZZ
MKWIKNKNKSLYVSERLSNQDGFIYLSHRRKSFREIAWADWDEKTESGWGDAAVNITIYDGGAVASETGQGVLTGDDRIHTQAGDVGAAVNDSGYYYRPMDGADDKFTTTDNWFNTLIAGQSQWFIGVKCYLDSTDVAGNYVFNWTDTDARVSLDDNGGKNRFVLADIDNVQEAQSTTDNTVVDTVGWACIWTGASKSRGGWKSGTHPVNWSDFEAGKRVEFVSLFDNIATLSTPTYADIFFAGVNMKGRIYAVVVAQGKTLIDDGA